MADSGPNTPYVDLGKELEDQIEEDNRRFPRDNFDWLSLDVHGVLSPSYSPFFDLPATTFDFGQGGYTASTNIGGELLQITAPYDGCGFLSVKGDFEDSFDAVLARAQRPRGDKATFGIKFVDPPPTDPDDPGGPSPHVRLGAMLEKGTFNHRWPFNRYALERDGEEIGQCSIFSCIKDGTLYQVVRLDTAGIRLADRTMPLFSKSHGDALANRVVIEFGGTFRFSCLCGGLHQEPPVSKGWSEGDSVGEITMPSLPGRSLKMQLFLGEDLFDKADYPPGRWRKLVDEMEKKYRRGGMERPRPFFAGRQLHLERVDSEKAFDTDTESSAPSYQSSLDGDGSRSRSVTLTSRKHVFLTGEPIVLVATFTITNRPEDARVVGSSSAADDRSETQEPKYEDEIDPNAAPKQPLPSEELHTLAGAELRLLDETVNPYATNLLWKEIYLKREVGLDLKSSMEEIHLAARTLEKMLGPYCLPVKMNGAIGHAPINTLCLTSAVTFQNLFWQIRFLVKIRQLFSSLTFADTSIRDIRNWRCNAILQHIKHLVSYLLISYMENGSGYGPRPPCRAIRAPGPSVAGKWARNFEIHETRLGQKVDESDGYYVMLMVSYLLVHCKEAIQPRFLEQHRDSLFAKFPRDEQHIGKENLIKTHILRWYHHEAVHSVSSFLAAYSRPTRRRRRESDASDYGHASQASITSSAWAADDLEDSEARIAQWRNVSQRSLTQRITAREPYTTDDEQCDRLILLAKKELRWNASDCVDLSHRRVLDRVRTTTLNPGRLLAELDGPFPISRASPWELHALCHHIRLFTCIHKNQNVNKQEDQDKIEQYRKRCLLFMTSEGLLVSSWERTSAAALQGWFTLEASAVVAASLVDILHRQCHQPETDANRRRSSALPALLRDLPATVPNSPELRSSLPPLPPARSDSDISLSSAADTLESDEFLQDTEDVQRAMLARLSELLEAFRQANKSFRPFNWKSYQPPVPFHVQSFFNSLDDSPHLFRSEELRRVQMRDNLRHWLQRDGDILRPPDYTIGNLATLFKLEDIGMLSVIDIKNVDTATDGKASSPYSNLVVTGRIKPQREVYTGPRLTVPDTIEAIRKEPKMNASNEVVATRILTQLIDRPYVGIAGLDQIKPEAAEFFDNLPIHKQDEFRQMSEMAWSDIRSKLVKTLRDSLVDQQIKYRIFFLQSCAPSVVRALAYVWHTEALDAFDDHFGNCSHFSSTNKASWDAKITLIYWNLKPRPSHDRHRGHRHAHLLWWKRKPLSDAEKAARSYANAADIQNEGRNRSVQFPPDYLGQKKLPVGHGSSDPDDSPVRFSEAKHHVEERATTIAMSSNSLGDFAKCTVISRIIDEESMEQFSRTAAEIWNAFVHQPQTTRCLMFLLLVGLTCENLSRRYEEMLDVLNKELGLSTRVLDDTLRWTDSDQVIVYLKQSLWALKALQFFHNTLTDSLSKIAEAKNEMMIQINMGPGRRHEVLEQMCQGYVEDFERQHSKLVTTAVKFQHRIEHITRFRDGISSVSSLEDGQTALRQDNNLQILTWITIGYLPLSFVAALFAVPDTQKVIDGELGVRWFVVIIVVFWLSTLMVANLLDHLFTWLRRFRMAGNSVWEVMSELVERIVHGRRPQQHPALF